MGRKKGKVKVKQKIEPKLEPKIEESTYTMSPQEESATIMSAVALSHHEPLERKTPNPDVMEHILKVLQEPTETMYKGLSQRAQYELSPQEVRELRELFSIFNIGGDGYLSYPTLRKSLKTMGFTAEDKELQGALADCNIDVEKGVNFSQFVDIVLIEQGDSIDVYEELMSGFSAMDIKRSGKLNVDSLRNLANSLGEEMTQTEIEDMIAEADKSGNGEVSQKEFIDVMLKTNLFRGSNIPQNKTGATPATLSN